MSAIPLQHGIFMAPYHDIDESPTIALRRDIQHTSMGSVSARPGSASTIPPVGK